MTTGRPKKTATQQGEHVRLSKATKKKLRAIARKRRVPMGDALDQVAGDQIDAVYAAECVRPRKPAPEPVGV